MPRGMTKRKAATDAPQNSMVYISSRVPGVLAMIPAMAAIMTNVDMEFTM